MFFYRIHRFNLDIESLVNQIKKSKKKYDYIYGIPQGGTIPALALSNALNIPLTETCHNQDLNVLIVDDLIDSGETLSNYIGFDVAVLGSKSHSPEKMVKFCGSKFPDDWIHFWWEPENVKEDPEKHVTRLLEYIGENPNREGLKETPKRVIKSFDKLYGGYKQDPKDVMKVFEEGACDQMVVLKDIELHSTCEHHMLSFAGSISIGYLPNGKVIGVSKLARLIEIFARRLQIQERIGDQVTDALMEYLKPLGAGCIIKAQHNCMKARGIEKQNSIMVTSSLKGVFLDKPEVRQEFMGLIK